MVHKTMVEARNDARQQQALLVLVILIGLNLRPFLTAIGPLSRDIAEALGLGMDTLAWLTLLPLWLIGGGVLLTPALRSRTGPRQLLGRPCCCWDWAAPCALRQAAAPCSSPAPPSAGWVRPWCRGCCPGSSSRPLRRRCRW